MNPLNQFMLAQRVHVFPQLMRQLQSVTSLKSRLIPGCWILATNRPPALATKLHFGNILDSGTASSSQNRPENLARTSFGDCAWVLGTTLATSAGANSVRAGRTIALFADTCLLCNAPQLMVEIQEISDLEELSSY